MSLNYLTKLEAASKIGASGLSGSDFVTKADLIATGSADTSKLSTYGSNDFVVDDNIIKLDTGIELRLYFCQWGTGTTAFRIEASKPVTADVELSFPTYLSGVAKGIRTAKISQGSSTSPDYGHGTFVTNCGTISIYFPVRDPAEKYTAKFAGYIYRS